ncbi:hypothetical protein [Bradyrhizobium sp. CCBAU 051011]|uniref:hypothetical protein n=1 Tax=Bradyrhizobium sp. CCBAU 051011 TaxID=858422 RepID=UPI001379C931|nr:hypothetical protein [Bradyrhizobium sp. CCBAU 051011]
MDQHWLTVIPALVNIAHFRKVNVLVEVEIALAGDSKQCLLERCCLPSFGKLEVADAALLF